MLSDPFLPGVKRLPLDRLPLSPPTLLEVDVVLSSVPLPLFLHVSLFLVGPRPLRHSFRFFSFTTVRQLFLSETGAPPLSS